MPARASGTSTPKAKTSKKTTGRTTKTTTKTKAQTGPKAAAKPTRATAKATKTVAPKPTPVVVGQADVQEHNDALKKNELILAAVERSGVRKRHARPVIEAALEVLGEAIAAGRDLNLHPMGRVIHQRRKDTENGRVTTVRIRQRAAAKDGSDGPDKGAPDNGEEVVADAAE